MTIPGDPYDFPIEGPLLPGKTALMIIDMQRDFCAPSGYMHNRGGDLGPARATIPRITAVREACWKAGIEVIYTREGHRPNLSDLPRCKRMKTALAGAEIGSQGPLGRLLIRGEIGWDFIDELQPEEDEIVIDKAGTGSFHGTDLHHILNNKKIENLIITGVTTGVCVNSTVREAADRGYNVLVLEDCCAEPDQNTHNIAIQLLKVEGGYLSTISDSEKFLSAMCQVSSQMDKPNVKPSEMQR
ncbi:MAG: cysteine hydrolase [Marinobacter sp.]|uniref:cysteine hydrolase family protein n=1 Tax=Marinobacter sp. TaxID=50741 RepID=UPI001B65E0F5|nr:isochorismatase family cysteine hydrolase [Marinobacter sp.]MBQ0747660.1 cysteine hydrolase [Marinobacter sp.]MBQ0815838.1 cysteine hydrolase [Marinobacter sp.]|tara:strand:- start:127 stop:855 length:729 start_codon:yes stop_codon:yes gene_type:complete